MLATCGGGLLLLRGNNEKGPFQMTSIPAFEPLYGDNGPNRLFPEPGYQEVAALGGNDRVIMDAPAYRILDGGAGRDALDYRGDDGFFVDLARGQAGFMADMAFILPYPYPFPWDGLVRDEYVFDTGSAGGLTAPPVVEQVIVEEVIEVPIIPPLPQRIDTLTGFEIVRGGKGNDMLTGSTGGDVLKGRAGNDALLGGAGRDKLFGGSGSDFIDDGAGRDLLTGGAGADLFILDLDGDRDVIRDFETGEDMLNLTGWGVDSFEDLTIRENRRGDTVVIFEDERLILRGDVDLTADDLHMVDYAFY